MNKYLKIGACMALLLLTFSSCGEDDEIFTDRETFIQAITGTWTVDQNSIIILKDEDITSQLLGFEITITEELRFQTNSNEVTFPVFPWPESGSFTLNDELNELERNDGLIIQFTHDELLNTVNFTFKAEEANIGRASGLSGAWKMTLSGAE